MILIIKPSFRLNKIYLRLFIFRKEDYWKKYYGRDWEEVKNFRGGRNRVMIKQSDKLYWNKI